MKKAFIMVITVVWMITLTGCRDLFENTESSETFTVITEFVEQTKDAVQKIAESGNAGFSPKNSISYEQIEPEEDPDLPDFSPNTVRYSFYSIPEEDYFQYAALPEKEKALYRQIVSAAKTGKAVIRPLKAECDHTAVSRIYRAVMADHPEFFYLAGRFLYTVSRSSDKVDRIFLQYTDGTVTDEYDKKGKIKTSADRAIISAQIAKFSERIMDLAMEIEPSADTWGIEKQLHDIVIDTVQYDTQAARQLTENDTAITHAFSAYGAACQGSAICEGYCKLFQILCYRFGIPCTPVIGTSEGEGHMWNAVRIEDEWTMVDVTWDDAEDDELRYYRYFNLTEEQMSTDHTVDREELTVPDCTSDNGAFTRRFALFASSLDDPPENYKEVIDRLAAGKDKYLCLAVTGTEEEMNRYMRTQIYSPWSAVRKYINEKHYDIRFDGQSYLTENYLYIHLS